MLLKRIRELDKELREEFEGFSLFKVSFKKLKKADEDTLEMVKEWYLNLKDMPSYREYKSLWKENKPRYWKIIQRSSSYLPEYQKLTYLRMVFVAECKRDLPEIIRYVNKDKKDI